jgi:hypothetical protein
MSTHPSTSKAKAPTSLTERRDEAAVVLLDLAHDVSLDQAAQLSDPTSSVK